LVTDRESNVLKRRTNESSPSTSVWSTERHYKRSPPSAGTTRRAAASPRQSGRRGQLGRTGSRGKLPNERLPLILGYELAGIVEAIGTEVSGFTVGDEVYGATNEQLTGAYAEYALPSARMMAQKPKTLSFIEAASAPIGTVAAWQMLFDYAHAAAGQTVLIHGAAGNVGAYSVQLAKLSDLHVVATAASSDLDYVRGLGAEELMDYEKEPFEESLNGVDVVLDTVGGETQERSLRVLKPGGILVSVVSRSTKALWRSSSVLFRGCDYDTPEQDHGTVRQRKIGYERRDCLPAGTSPHSTRDARG
jgi:NADPH:quinone reductase-like Zn-dependent oxidoreductase